MGPPGLCTVPRRPALTNISTCRSNASFSKTTGGGLIFSPRPSVFFLSGETSLADDRAAFSTGGAHLVALILVFVFVFGGLSHGQIQRPQFEQAIGQLSIAWAIAEHGLDQCIGVLYYAKGGDQLGLAIPMNARKKIKFFRRVCTELNLAHDGDPDDGETHASIIANLAIKALDDRNWCIHGVAFGAIPDTFDNDIVFTRLQRPALTQFERKKVTLQDIEATRLECVKLAVAFGFFLYTPLNFLTKEHVQNTFDSLGIEFAL